MCSLSLSALSLPYSSPSPGGGGADSQPCAPGLAGRLRVGWPVAGDPRMTFESRPCQFTELPFLISVTAGESRQIIDGGHKEGRGPGSWREGEADQPTRSGYLRRPVRSFATRGTSGNLCFPDNSDEYTRFLKIA